MKCQLQWWEVALGHPFLQTWPWQTSKTYHQIRDLVVLPVVPWISQASSEKQNQ